MNTLTDEQLLSLVQQGNKLAFEEVYARYGKKLLAFIYRMVNGRESIAQDILQDVFTILLEKPESFDINRKFKPWIYTIASNACKQVHRNQRLTYVEELPTTGQETAEQPNLIDSKHIKHQIESQIGQLGHKQKEVFILKHQQNYSLSEISEILNIPIGTVKSRLFTATKILSKKLTYLYSDHIKQ